MTKSDKKSNKYRISVKKVKKLCNDGVTDKETIKLIKKFLIKIEKHDKDNLKYLNDDELCVLLKNTSAFKKHIGPKKIGKIKIAPDEAKIKEGWPMYTDTSFTKKISQKFKKYKLSDKDDRSCKEYLKRKDFKPFPYQKFIRDFLSPKTGYRGLLLYHGLGSGKTCSAIMAAEANAQKFKVVVMLPGSLRSNFINELMKCGPEKYKDKSFSKLKEYLSKHPDYKIITYNQSNVINSLPKTFDNTFVIVDEAHTFGSIIRNRTSKNGRELFNRLINAKNMKILLLTGTPITNHPFEAAILFNLIRPGIFPYDEEEFQKEYINKGNKGVEKFQKKIEGLSSYYRGATPNMYAQKIIHPVDKITMSKYQQEVYDKAAEYELVLNRILRNKKKRYVKTMSQRLSEKDHSYISGISNKLGKREIRNVIDRVYSIFTRQAANFALPKELKAFERFSKAKKTENIVENAMKNIKKKDLLLKNIGEYSKKFELIIKRVKKSNGPVLIYSNFKELEGVGLMEKALLANDISCLKWTGDISDSERNIILAKFNNENNKYGQNYKVLLSTAAGAQGISLHNVRQVHIMEPHWHVARIDQVIGRSIRICSNYKLKQS